MTYTPDRKRQASQRRADSENSGSRAASGRGPGPQPSDCPAEDAINGHSSLADQLREAGLDLTGHELAEVFDALDPVADHPAADGIPDADIEPVQGQPQATTPGAMTSENGKSEEIGDSAVGGEAHIDEEPICAEMNETAQEAGDTARERSQHPLLTASAWNDLVAFAPEITDSIIGLKQLDEELRVFDRPMGPEQALELIDGAEAVRRLSESLSTLALAVYERIGTPQDSGAKDTKALIQERLSLTGREADRRSKLAQDLGGRVNVEGQALPPEFPTVAEKFHDGTLSAEQVASIERCLHDLPNWVDPAVLTKVEKDLVAYAPRVAVSELRAIFNQMLAHIDPDGTEPIDSKDRSSYFITARPKRNGDWRVEGILDPVAGSELHGLLTSRIESASDCDSDPNALAAADCGTDSDGAFIPNAGLSLGPGQERFSTIDSVLTGDRDDAPSWAVVEVTRPDRTVTGVGGDASGADADRTDVPGRVPDGHGVRQDGSTINLMGEQPTPKNWIYERFATLISRISMKEAEKGSPYALVVSAKAEDLATDTGEGTTGAGHRFPIDELTTRGLNGTVFFHLMDESARTVAVKTENRFANKKQTAIVTARDRGCTFPGCEAPPGWCDVNHVVPYSRGGKTDINNLCLSCSYHHHLMDRTSWETRMLKDGRPAWVPPESIDPARRPILHSRFITDDIIEGLFDD